MSNLIRLHGNGPLVSPEVDAILCHWRATYRLSIGKSIDAAIRFCASHPDFSIQAPAPDDTPRRGHRTPLNKEQKERIICLSREEKRTQKEIASEFGIHINTVRNICKTTQPSELI
jgi:DNA-binding CsgD family transcriptional regulator